MTPLARIKALMAKDWEDTYLSDDEVAEVKSTVAALVQMAELVDAALTEYGSSSKGRISVPMELLCRVYDELTKEEP